MCTLPPQEKETEAFVEGARLSVDLLSSCPVEQLREQDAALEFLQRLYLLSLEFTSVMGKMSRVAFKVMCVSGHKTESWPEEMKQRHNPMYGLIDNQEKLIVKRLHENEDIDFVKDLMQRAGLKVDTRTNRDDANALRQGLDQVFYYDQYLDRALSIRLADTIIKLDKLLTERIAAMAEKQRLLDLAKRQLREQQQKEAARKWPVRVLLWLKRLITAEVNQQDLAEAELRRALDDLAAVESAMRYELETAYRVTVIGKKTLPDDEYAECRAQKFYQDFFGCSWRDAYTSEPQKERLVGQETVKNRMLAVARMQQLRRKLALDETYVAEHYTLEAFNQ